MRYLFAILALGLLVAFHELGHLLAARAFRIKVLRYSVGFGPAIFTFRRGQTEYTLGAIPLGGFVRIQGMNPHEEGARTNDPASFAAKRPGQRLLVLLAGSFFNYLLAIVVLIGLHLAGTHMPVPMTIGAIEPGSAAALAQLRPGDRVAAVEGEPIEQWSRLVERVNDSPGKDLRLTLGREGEKLEVTVQPREENGVGRLGIAQQYVFRRLALGEAVSASFGHAHRLMAEGLRLLWRLLSGKGGVQLTSPIGVVKAASDAASTGLDAFLRVLVSISIALAVFNLLPVPALDGGRAAFVAVEAATGRKVSPKVETLLHTLGFVLLIALIFYIAAQDVRRLVASPPPPPSGRGP
ncbi:MAG: M50 family metallopeptidase [Myxococcota bacterium]